MTKTIILAELQKLRGSIRQIDKRVGTLIARHWEHALSPSEERDLIQARADMRAGKLKTIEDIARRRQSADV